MTTPTDIHSCSYFCTRPACVLAQRDEMRAELARLREQEPVAWIQHHKAGDNLVWDDPGGKKSPMYAAAPPAQPAAQLQLVQATAPREIWLQVSDEDGDNSEPFPDDPEGITWCQDSVLSCEVKYVRADLAAQPAPTQPADQWRDKIGQALADYMSKNASDGVFTIDPFDSRNIDSIVDVVVAAQPAPDDCGNTPYDEGSFTLAQPAPAQEPAQRLSDEQDAARYRLLRVGRYWSVINGIGDELRAWALDSAIDSIIEKTRP